MLASVQIQVLANFLAAIDHDPRIRSTHIAAYMALYKCWMDAQCPDKLKIRGREIMEIAKISSTATWHRSIRALSEYGYIRYYPTFNKMAHTLVQMRIT